MSFKRTMGLNPKSEARNPKEFRNPKSEKAGRAWAEAATDGRDLRQISAFGVRPSFGFRVSGFGFSSHAPSSPMQLAAEGLTKRAAGQVHQDYSLPAPLNCNRIPRGKLRHQLPAGA